MLTKDNIKEMYPLSPMQESMFFHSLLSPDSQAYFEQMAYRIQGDLDPSVVRKSLNKLVGRHDVLRTVFIHKTLEKPIQVVLKKVDAYFYFEDISHSADPGAFISEFKKNDREKTFDLGKDRLMRVAILKVGKGEFEFIWSFHHIVMDGWCLSILHSEFMEIYRSIVEERPFRLNKPKPFLEYIKWLEKQDVEQHRLYWQHYLEGFEEPTGIPSIRWAKPDTSDDSEYRNEELRFSLGKKQSDTLRGIAKQHSVSLNTLLQSLWAVLIGKYSGKNDVVFGAVVSGRPVEIEGVEAIVGLFINTIPVRYKMEGSTSLADLVQETNHAAIAGQAFHYGALAEIMSGTTLKSNLIDHLFVFENYPLRSRLKESGGGLNGFEITGFDNFDQTDYNLNVMVFPGEDIHIKFRYNASVYSRSLIEQLTGHLNVLVEKASKHMLLPLSELSLLSAGEIEDVAINFNLTASSFDGKVSVKELFERQVALSPEKLALCYEDWSFTYRQLNEQVNQLSHFLISVEQLGPEKKAIVLLSRSHHSVIVLLALSKIGVCYVPISQDLPRAFIEILLEEAKGDIVITESALSPTLDLSKEQVLEVDRLDLDGHDIDNPVHCNRSDEPMYIIYTSGSSGVPKGVVQKYGTLSNLVQWQMRQSGLEMGLRMLQYTSFSFDVSLQDVYYTLSSGGCLYVLPDQLRLEFVKIWDFIYRYKIELVSFPTTVLLNLFREESGVRSEAGSLKHIVTAGEQLVLNKRLKDFLREHPHVQLHNHYGPSETHVVTSFTISGASASQWDKVPIGKPISNSRIYILDDRLKPVPKGVEGELFIAGAHVAKGYLNQATLTGERFLKPFLPWEREVLYRSGDMGRWLGDGNIEFLGRKDRQVKVKGNRIELREIEIVLRGHDSIKEAVVLTKQDNTGENYLVGFLITENKLDPQACRAYLMGKLPSYMVPTIFVEIGQVPLTRNGKVDENALHELPIARSVKKHEPPKGEVEEQLAAIWSKVLALDEVGRNDNFFEVGGHSLRAARVLAHIQKEFKVKVVLKDIFKYPTVAALAKVISQEEVENFCPIPVIKEQANYELSHAQRRIWLIQQASGAETAYNMAMSYDLKGEFNLQAFEKAFQLIIQRHEILRTVFPVEEGTPRQKVLPFEGLGFKVYQQDLRGEDDSYATAKKMVRSEAKQPFDLSEGPLIRVKLLRTEQQRHLLIVTLHHIIFDGWSINIFFNEIAVQYNACLKQAPLSINPPLRIQYKDYTAWHNASLSHENAHVHKEFWMETFQLKLHRLNLPLDFHRPIVLSYEGKNISFTLSESLSLQLKSFAKERELSLFMVLLSIIKSWVYLMTGQEDIVIGSPVAGRNHVDLDDQLGFYSNTLPLRSRFSSEWDFERLVRTVAENTFAAYQHQQYPLDLLIEDLGIKHERNRSPLFDILFVLQNNETGFQGMEGLEIKNFSSGGGAGLYDLLLSVQEHDGQLHMNLVFNTSLFTEDTATTFLHHLVQITRSVVENPTQAIADIDRGLSTKERAADGFYVLNSVGGDTAVNTVGNLYMETSVRTGTLPCPADALRITKDGKELILTGDKARVRQDGTIEILGFKPHGFIHQGRYHTTESIEKCFLTSPFVSEVQLVNFQGNSERSVPLVHVVYKDYPDENRLKKWLEGHLPAGFVQKIRYNALDYILRDENGSPDFEKLAGIKLIDQEDFVKLEKTLKSVDGIGEATYFLNNRYREQGYVQLPDFLSEATLDSLNKIAHMPRVSPDTTIVDVQPYPENAPLAIARGGTFNIATEKYPQTLVEALLSTVSHFPDKKLIFVDKEGQENHISYRDLFHQAKCFLNGLQKEGLRPGDSLILQVEYVPDYLAMFWAAVLGGIIPVTVAKPLTSDKSDTILKKLYGIWSLLDKPRIVTGESGSKTAGHFGNYFPKDELSILSLQEFRSFQPSEVLHQPEPEEVVLYQLSSGSTGTSKCIQQTHKALILHILASQHFNNYGSEDVTLNWLPFDHVVPLVTFHIKDVFLGIEQVHVDTSIILSDPLTWLDCIEKYRVTHSWSPNFGYKLVGKRLLESPGRFWDLGRLKSLMNAGEQVTLAGIQDFIDCIGNYGVAPSVMQPAFGMAEVCTCMTYNNTFRFSDVRRYKKGTSKSLIPAEEDEAAVTFIDLGPPICGVDIRITDQDNEVLPENCIGRFQIKSPSVTPGYLKNPEANGQAFVGEGWFNSGDLGFISDGRLFITGREKEEVIIRGVNYHCYDIEEIVSRIEGVEATNVACASLAEESSGTESLLLFFSPAGEVFPQLIADIKKEVSRNIGIAPDVIVPVSKAEFPKTTSGKIQRTQLKEMFEAGVFDAQVKAMDALLKYHRKSVPEWFYEHRWKPKQRLSTLGQYPKKILVFEPAHFPIPSGVHQSKWIRVEKGQAFRRLDAAHFTIREDYLEDYQSLAANLQKDDNLPELVLHAWNYDDTVSGRGEEDLLKAQKVGVISLIRFLKVWEGFQQEPLRLVLLTSLAKQVFPDETIDIFKASLQGFVKSASEEMPWLSCSQLDVPFGKEDMAIVLKNELSIPFANDDEVAYRNASRYVSTLSKLTLPETVDVKTSMSFKRGGMYWITGGLGGLGIPIAQYLIQTYDASLLITGRTDLEPLLSGEAESRLGHKVLLKRQKLEQLKALGNPVHYEAVDVCDLEAMKVYLEGMETRWNRKLDGIIHLAGEVENVVAHWDNLESHLIHGLKDDMYYRTLKSKAWGTLQLTQLLKERPEVMLIGFSSVNSYFGGYSFAAYSAASSLQDYITLDFAKGRKVYSLNWSMWDDLGINQGNEFKYLAANKGFSGLTILEGLNSMEVALRLDRPQVFIGIDGNNSSVRRQLNNSEYASKVLDIIYTNVANENIEDDIFQAVGKHHFNIPVEYLELEELPRDQEGDIDQVRLYQYVVNRRSHRYYHKASSKEEIGLISIWEQVLGIKGIGVTDNFFELGGDSLNAMLVTSRIYEYLGVNLGMQELFLNPSIRQLAKVLITKTRDKKQNIPPLNVDEPTLASRAEERLWFLSKVEGVKAAYNVYGAYIINGAIDRDALDRAFKLLVKRYEVLRTSFTFKEGRLYHHVHADFPEFMVDFTDISQQAGKEGLLHSMVHRARNIDFDLEKGPLLNVQLLRMEPDVHVFLLTLHHIVWDAWSERILFKELFLIYQAELQGAPFPLPPLKIQYKDYVAWFQEKTKSQEFKKIEDYWRNQLKGLPLLDFPTDYVRPAVKTYAGDRQFFTLTERQSGFVTSMAKERGVSIYMLLLASVKALLYRYTMQEDFAIGMPISGRNHVELEQQIGLFLNTLVLRTRFDGNAGFLDLLEKVKQTATAAYHHRDYPFDLLVDNLDQGRDPSRSPLFDILVTMLPSVSRKDEITIPGLTFEPLFADFLYSKFDLSFLFKEEEGQISVIVEFNTDLFSKDRIARLIGHYKGILDAVILDQEQPLHRLDFIPTAEKERIIQAFNATQSDFPAGLDINVLLDRQVEARPDDKALVFDEVSYTYAHLDQTVRQLANYMKEVHHVRSGDRVTVLLDRSHASVISMLAIFRLGACYIPIDSTFPENRIDFILNDVKPKLVLSQSDLERDIKIKHKVDLDLLDLSSFSIDFYTPQISSADPAYVIYTSGSTGTPKGVVQTYGMLYNLVQWDLNSSCLSGGNLLQYSSFSFDSSLHDVLYTLSVGGTVHLIGKRMKLELDKLVKYIVDQEIHILSLPFAALGWLMSFLKPTAWAGHVLRHIVSTGEQLLIGGDLEYFLRENPEVTLHNFYGPSETHVVTAYTLTGADKEMSNRPPIGKPIANTFIYILDKYGNLVPEGIPGQVYIGGANLALGYLNNEKTTMLKFVSRSIQGEEVLLYDSGDIGLWGEDGNITYLGRKDKQVKVYGYRIELGEIEYCLMKHEKIDRALVTVKEDSSGVNQLIAYLVVNQGLSIAAIRNYLGSHLPKYMVPSHFMIVDGFETTTVGKIDYRALPDPFAQRAVRVARESTMPESKVAQDIWLLWKRLLHLDEISIYDNFFDLGGNSMKLIYLRNELNKLFPGKVSITDLFKYPSIDLQASYLSEEVQDIPKSIEL